MFARLIALAIVVACAAPAVAQDRDTFRAVQRSVLRYVHFTIFDSVHADVDNGVVTLTGKVTMPYKREDIERRVTEASGVREVHNRIEVLPASLNDDRLRVDIARAIYGHSAFQHYAGLVNPPIHVVVERGRVTLEGVVLNDLERTLATSLASGFLAFDVKNELRTDEEARAELNRL